MIARISLLRKRQDLSQAEFLAHWLGPHAAIARQVPGLRGLVTYSPEEMPLANCDGIGIMWFDSLQDAKDGFTDGPVLRQLKEDRPKFLEDVQVFFAQEHLLIPPPQINSATSNQIG